MAKSVEESIVLKLPNDEMISVEFSRRHEDIANVDVLLCDENDNSVIFRLASDGLEALYHFRCFLKEVEAVQFGGTAMPSNAHLSEESKSLMATWGHVPDDGATDKHDAYGEVIEFQSLFE